jgi:hypothetical protein
MLQLLGYPEWVKDEAGIDEYYSGVSGSRESLLKGKDQYSLPPCTNQFRSAAFHTETIFFFFT